jgi:hypothetical protein
MPRNPRKPPGPVAFTVMALIALTTGVVLLAVDYAVGTFSAVRKRFRAITKV